MTSEHERFATWDGAYVLGALSAADRGEYERHLDGCELCRAAVAELAPTAGLLSRLSADRAAAIDETDPSPRAAPVAPHPVLRERLVATARRRRRRVVAAWVGAAAAVLLIIAVPGVVALTGAPTDGGGIVYALDDVAGAPLEASVKLTPVEWGTRIDLVCEYTGEVLDAPPGGWPYALAVTDDRGATTMLSTWRAGPGSTTELSAGTDVSASRIDSIEIRTVDGDRVVMRRDFDSP
ncbi:zf-HC2 domain-containing protein [Microbacterium enclense]|uniref:anti-sigma factor family protein n=1 Tax=Microbacterium enclense TaxID=993073 RepID=UPI0021A632DB|nr:zf-HC2 domain-containing protein [Microbacterium enclense]MCT2086472.1 zf-HC2 domain-containing protein [Microbacterium enclense]